MLFVGSSERNREVSASRSRGGESPRLKRADRRRRDLQGEEPVRLGINPEQLSKNERGDAQESTAALRKL